MAGSNPGNSVAKAKMGRPTKFTDEVLRKLEEAFAIGASDKEACFYADIAPSALYEYQKRNVDFVERKAALKERPVLLARQKVIKAIETGDMQTTRWFLERKQRQEFAAQLDITTDGQALPQPILNFVINQSAPNVTKDDVIDVEADDKTPQIPAQATQPNIMEDINGNK